VLAYRFNVSGDRKEQVHKELYQHLITENKTINADYFHRMREIRIDADYFFQKEMNSKFCDKMIWLHDKIIENLEIDAPF